MDWFERITGFRELHYDSTRSRLSIVDGRLVSSRSEATWKVGQLETPTLRDLRARAAGLTTGHGPNSVHCLSADVRELHRRPENAGALFQVASQFNLLEMVGPDVTPEHGVTATRAITPRVRPAPSRQVRPPSSETTLLRSGNESVISATLRSTACETSGAPSATTPTGSGA